MLLCPRTSPREACPEPCGAAARCVCRGRGIPLHGLNILTMTSVSRPAAWQCCGQLRGRESSEKPLSFSLPSTWQLLSLRKIPAQHASWFIFFFFFFFPFECPVSLGACERGRCSSSYPWGAAVCKSGAFLMHLSSSPPSVPQCLAMGSSDPTLPLRLGFSCPCSLPLRHTATQPTARPLALRVLNLLQKVARKL